MKSRGRVFGKPSMDKFVQDGGMVVGHSTIFVKDIPARNQLKDLKDEQRVVVFDASMDENASQGVSEYIWKDEDWLLLAKNGEDGKDGKDGKVGPQGPKGDPFKYSDFTLEQLEALRGPRGPKGDDGTNGIDGNFTMIIDYERQMDSVEADEGDKLYVKELESEFIWIDGEWVGLGGGDGGTADSILAEKVVTNNSLQFISRDQKKMIRENQKEIEALKLLLDTLEFDSEGKIKNNTSDTLGYLEDKIGETLTFRKDVLEVVKLLGQIVSVDDINQLDGIRANVQEQIDSLSRVGNFTGSVEDKNELLSIQDAGVGDMVIVLEDESKDNESTVYMHDGAEWQYVGKFNIKVDLKAEDIKVKDTEGKFPVSKNVEAALAYLSGKFDTMEEAMDEFSDCCSQGGGSSTVSSASVIQVEERRDLPQTGDKDTLYVVDEDETNNGTTSLYVWKGNESTGKGEYTLLISASVGGVMQEYQQVTKLGVRAPREYDLAIPRTQNFLRAPIEVLEFSRGKNDLKVDTEYSNCDPEDFGGDKAFFFLSNGFTLDDYASIPFVEDDGKYIADLTGEKLLDIFFGSKVPDSGPGPSSLKAGDYKGQGYFGTLKPEDFFTLDQLTNAIEVEPGSELIKDDNFEWIKYWSEGKVLFIPNKSLRKSVTFNELKNNNLVYGNRTIEDRFGNKYKIRLIKGLNSDAGFVNDGNPADNLKYSEWNTLRLPMHERAKVNDWKYPEYVEFDLPYWGHKKKDDYFGIQAGVDGRSAWCMEDYNASGTSGYARSTGKSPEWYASATKTYGGSNMGWLPVLELVKKPTVDGGYWFEIDGVEGVFEDGWRSFEESGKVELMSDAHSITRDELEMINGKSVKIISMNEGSFVHVIKIPDEGLLLANGDIALKSVDNIDFFDVVYEGAGDYTLKVIVSVDEGKNWSTYNSGVWEEVRNKEDIVDYGMTPQQMKLIPSKSWNELRKYSNSIRFGYYIKYNSSDAYVRVESLNAQFDMTGTWKASIHGKDFEYEYPDNSTIKVKILKDGDYKINY